MRICKYLFTLILTAAIILSAVGCGGDEGVKNREYDEIEVKSAARELIAASILLNEIYWGKGIPCHDDLNLASGNYYPADEDYLENIGIKTLEDLKNLTRGTFSKEMSEWVFSSVLTSVSDGSFIAGTARYGQKWGGERGDEPEYILVYKDYDYLLSGRVEYHLERLSVIGSEGEIVKVKVPATVYGEGEGEFMDSTLEISLIEEEGGWRLDSPTYLKYYNPKK